MEKYSKLVKQLVVVLAIFLAWHFVTAAELWSAFILPPPQVVFETFVSMVQSGELLDHILISTWRVFVGASISFALALLLGMVAGLRPKATEYYGFLLEFLRNIPPLALIPMLILWFGIGEASRIIIIVLTMFFPVYLNVKKGFLSVDPKLLEVGKMFDFCKFKLFSRIMVPHAMPNILIGARVGLGFAWRAIIAAEMIAAASGLGFMIWHARQMSSMATVIVGILTIGVIGILVDKVFSLATRKVVKGGEDDSWS